MTDAATDKFDLDMTMRLAADRVLRAITLKRQAKVAVLASAVLSVVAAVRPDLLPPDLLVLKDLLNVGAISGLLKKVAEGGEKMTDEAIAAEMAALLPLNRLDDLVTGQKDLLRALTRQHTWQQQMLRLQEADREAGAQLLAGFAEMTGDLAAIRESLAGVATAAQVDDLTRLIVEKVLPRLSEPVQAMYYIAVNVQAGPNIFFISKGGINDKWGSGIILNPTGLTYIPDQEPNIEYRRQISSDDLNKIVQLIITAQIMPFDPYSRDAFLALAGLELFIKNLPMSGTQWDFVTTLVRRTANYGPLKNEPSNNHALGILLTYIRDLEATPTDICLELDSLVKKYDLGSYPSGADSGKHILGSHGNHLSITTENRKTAFQKLVKLNRDDFEYYAYIFGVSLPNEWGEKENPKVAQLLLKSIEDIGKFWEIYRDLTDTDQSSG